MNSSKSLLLAIAAILVPLAAYAQSSQIPACTQASLHLTTDAEGGAFNGMSHSGTLVIIRNLGPSSCRLSPIAQITVTDRNGKNLGARGVLPGARFMHPGPVVLPFVLPPGAEATAGLRWVSGPVYPKNVCIEPMKLRVSFGPVTLTTEATARMCGDATVGITFEQARFATDPVYRESTTNDSVNN